jgi:putative transposon-encoded protein
MKEKKEEKDSNTSGKEKKEIIIKFGGSEIIERAVSKFGTGAHIVVPKEYAGKKVKIIFEDEK